MTAIVTFKNVFQHVKGRCVLDDINVNIEQGESFALLGPNGAGKTLLLRLIMGLDRPSSGRVEVLGREFNSLSHVELTQLRRSIGMVIQSGALLNGLTVLENLILPLRNSGDSVARMRRSARLIMTQLRLDGMENLRPNELSGGVMRKVELARALICKPALLLWDELMDGLDPVSALEILNHLQREKENNNMTFIFTTHQSGGAVLSASRIGVLDNGRLLFEGSHEQLVRAKAEQLELRYTLEGRS